MSSSTTVRYFLIALGWVFVALGVIGIFLPVMPTTIFLILAAACFARSSEKFYTWLIEHKTLGKFIRDYREKRGMPLKAKLVAILLLNLSIGYSSFFVVESLIAKILLLGVALSVTLYLISLKTLREVEK
jgi:uncharacterized membrane protein YbaN (DUF454 family)